MPGPKFSFKKNNSSLLKEKLFVDREQPRTLFYKFAEKLDKQFNILMYYGVGGIGKSSLLRDNRDYFVRTYPNSLCFSVDLSDSTKRSIAETLKEFAENCSNKQLSFDAFDLAYALYYSKKNSGEEYNKEKNSLENRFNLFFKLVGIVDNGITETAVSIIEKAIGYAKKKQLDDYVLEDLKQMGSRSLVETEATLPAYFAYDVSRFASKTPGIRILFTIDTFEVLNVQQTEEIHRMRNEDWVKEIIRHFDAETVPQCGFMISGRDRLLWDEDLQPYIIHCQLDDFDTQWSMRYLIEQGVLDRTIASDIIKSSKGNPFYLYLSAKLYNELKSRGITPTAMDLGCNSNEIIKRFIYNLGDEEVNILKYIAVPNFFNYDIFKFILSRFSLSFDPERFSHIISYSFVSQPSGTNYHIHSLMRGGLAESTGSISLVQVNQFMLDYYLAAYKDNASVVNYSELIYHAARCKSADEFNVWFDQNGLIEYLLKLQIDGDQPIIFRITEDLIRQFGNNHLCLDIINIYIDALHLGGDYLAAVNSFDSYLAPYSMQKIIETEGLCKMLIRKVHHSMFFKPVDGLVKEAQEIVRNEKIRQYSELYIELLFLLGGNLGILSGDFESASKWLNSGLQYAKDINQPNQILRFIRKVADLEVWRGNADKAITMIEQYIRIDSSIDNRYEIYVLGALGEAYRKIGNKEVSRQCYETILEKCKEKNLIGWVGHSEMALSMLDYEKGDYEAVIISCEKIYNQYCRYSHAWGQINSRTLWLMAKYKLENSTLYADDTKALLDFAREMNYLYNVAILEELIEKREVEYLQFFFL